MSERKLEIKLSFVPGLKPVVLRELEEHSVFSILEVYKDSVYVDFMDDFILFTGLKSVSRAYLVVIDPKYNPAYISNHKSVLGDLIEIVINKNQKGSFKTFKISCAGSDSPEIKEINEYIEKTFGLSLAEESDLKIHIIKTGDLWEVGMQITPRPLSLREYKVRNMSGAMDPTIAYALNSLSSLDSKQSYLNIFSGSGTLLIEAAENYPNLTKLVGFDNDKERLSLSIQNIKKAGLIKKVQVKEGNIFDKPDLGTFDVITADLPFGMVISKNEDLEKLYTALIEYSKNHLNKEGILSVYTSEFKIFEKLIQSSDFDFVHDLEIKLITAEEQYLPTKILVYKLK